MSDAYRHSGVDYDVLDAAKRRALEAVRSSLDAPAGRGARVVAESVGEPAQLLEVGGVVLATVLECLGTKSTIAAQVEAELGEDHWAAIGTDAVAAVVNDLACMGALPLSVSAYVATGSAGFYAGARHASLLEGWRQACEAAGAAFVGGESPTLAGIVADDGVDLAGSSVGRVPDGARAFLGSRLEPGDEIVLVASSGLHANGASLARAVAASLPARWATPLGDGRLLGAAVLEPSVLYVAVVEACQTGSLSGAVHYASHLTGHGLRKLMRADRELTYRVAELQPVPEVLSFLAGSAGLPPAEAYGTFNMGSGFALFVEAGRAGDVARLAERLGYSALVAGVVEEGPRRVVLEPLGVSYGADELELR
ncbi:MAG TPA: AIR synthase related protein [Acidimicrobiales bacterium]|nr:AIR synthase related protein [Acidimicrobiales bacterium]